ncbi:MAG: GNAT family N-acetyltransferase [Armatimonadota bacterium]
MARAEAERAEAQAEPRVRRLNPRRDLEQVLEFQREVYEVNFPGFRVDHYFLEEYSRDLRRAARDPAQMMFVLEHDGRVCGFIWGAVMSTLVDAKVGYIKNVYVVPHLRGMGQAQRLMTAVEQWLYDQGADKVMLDASVCNPRAVAFYQRVGYSTERVRMVKHLGPSDDLHGLR